MTTTASITLDAAGRGTATINGQTQEVTGPDLQTARGDARDWIVGHAETMGEPVLLHVTEPQGSWDLMVQPNGTIGDAPAAAPQPPAPAPDPAPQVESAPMTQPPAPSPLDDDPELAQELARPATIGLRGTLNKMGLQLSPSALEVQERRSAFLERRSAQEEEKDRARHEESQREREAAAERAERELIQSTFLGTRTILVANPKGGSRKTTSTYALAATMGTIRGGAVVAWDANETMGTLGERARQDPYQRTVVDLLEDAAPSFGSVEGIRLGALDGFVRPQGDSHFDVLASDEDPERQDMVDGQTFGVVHEMLSRFYRVIFVDTGNNIRVSHFQAALDAADQLVIPVAASRDSARAARKMLRAFSVDGHQDLVRSAVVLLHDLEPAQAASADYLAVVRDITAEFEPLVSDVIAVPFDPALKGGDIIDYAQLSEDTRTAYRRGAAAVAGSLLRHTAA